MKRKAYRLIMAIALGSAMLLCSACGGANSSQTSETSAAAEETPLPEETQAPTETPTPEPTATPEPTPTPEETPEPEVGMANPWSETNDLEEASKGSGIRLSPPVEEAIPKQENMQFWKYRWMEGTIEALYESVNDEMTIRASLDTAGDELAGDYNTYSKTWDETLKGLTVHCKGDGEKISVATFDADNMHYSITYNPGNEERGLTADELNSLVMSLQAVPYTEGETPTPTPETNQPPRVTADPTDETVPDGGACLYIATAENADTLEWHFVSPDGQTDVPYNQIGGWFSTLVVNGGNQETLSLSNIPLNFNGWRSYCRFTGKGGTADSGHAVTFVKEKETPTPTPTPIPSSPVDGQYAGTYYESIAGRGVITITGSADNYYVSVTWPGSAAEVADWNFSGQFDSNGVMYYNNCSKVHTVYEEDGIGHPTEEYSGGTGSLQITNNGIVWTDNQENIAADAVFVKG